MEPILRGYQPKKSITTKPPITPPTKGSSAVPPKAEVDSLKAMQQFADAFARFSASFEKLSEAFGTFKETDMYTEKIILKSISYEETEAIVDYYGDIVYLVFHRKDVPEICHRVKDVYVSLHRYDLEIPKKITAFAKADVYETLTTEYLVAPGKKLIDSFANNGIVIQKIG